MDLKTAVGGVFESDLVTVVGLQNNVMALKTQGLYLLLSSTWEDCAIFTFQNIIPTFAFADLGYFSILIVDLIETWDGWSITDLQRNICKEMWTYEICVPGLICPLLLVLRRNTCVGFAEGTANVGIYNESLAQVNLEQRL